MARHYLISIYAECLHICFTGPWWIFLIVLSAEFSALVLCCVSKTPLWMFWKNALLSHQAHSGFLTLCFHFALPITLVSKEGVTLVTLRVMTPAASSVFGRAPALRLSTGVHRDTPSAWQRLKGELKHREGQRGEPTWEIPRQQQHTIH